MSWKPYVANALIAAALGAGTNELAIIAILRFILPSKKAEIARRIRDIIATDLLSPAKMQEKMDDPQIGELLFRHIDDALAGLLARELPSPDDLLSGHEEVFSSLLNRLRTSLLDEYSQRVSAADFSAAIVRPFLEERWQMLRNRTPRSLLHRSADTLPADVASWLESLESSDYLRTKLRRGLDGWLSGRMAEARSPAELFSPAIATAAEELAVSQAPVIVEQLTDLLRQPEVSATISNAIMDAIRRQLRGQGVMGGLKGIFANAIKIEEDVRGVVKGLPDTLHDNFHQPHNRAKLARVLRDAVRKTLERDMDANLKSDAMRSKVLDLLMERLWQKDTFARFGEQATRSIARGLDNTVEQLLEKAGVAGSGEVLFDEAAERCRRILAAPATRDLLASQYDEAVAAWRVRPLGKPGRFISEETRKRLAGIVADEIRLMLRQRLGEFAEESGVWDIVTKSIENYNNDELVALIKQLARSELRMVTVLGGVIGLVVGILQTYMHTLGWF